MPDGKGDDCKDQGGSRQDRRQVSSLHDAEFNL
jgi:hypothetical protein